MLKRAVKADKSDDECTEAKIQKQIVLSSNNSKFTNFNLPCIEFAKKLLGKYLVRQLEDGTVIRGVIVETESYLGGEDKASQSYNFKVTERNKPMFMKPGTAYVYFTYGMYHCFNISCKGEGAAVLLRAVDPHDDCIDIMRKLRNDFVKSRKSYKENTKKKELKVHELCNGPSKLCISFNINLSSNKLDLNNCNELWIENNSDVQESMIINSKRIGIDSAGPEWASKLLRYYIKDNKSVSKK